MLCTFARTAAGGAAMSMLTLRDMVFVGGKVGGREERPEMDEENEEECLEEWGCRCRCRCMFVCLYSCYWRPGLRGLCDDNNPRIVAAYIPI